MIAYSKLILRETGISLLRRVSVSCYLPFEIFISLCDYIFPLDFSFIICNFVTLN